MHIPVLLKESLDYLNAAKGGRFIDGTAGAGGHTIGILRANPKNEVLSIDWDKQAVVSLKEKLRSEKLDKRAKVVHGNYADMAKFAGSDFDQIDGIILDLGFSSGQIDEGSRGFSFQQQGPLDMRYDSDQQLTAQRVINDYPETKLVEILNKYGEEKFSKKIAQQIVRERKLAPVADTAQVFRLIRLALPKPLQYKASDSARRVFQAIRIEVNSELKNLERVLPQTLKLLKQGGRVVIISFHSLEDRMVKRYFQSLAKDCVCPTEFPVCVCGKAQEMKILTRKPAIASEQESSTNPRSKSAKLRAAEKLT